MISIDQSLLFEPHHAKPSSKQNLINAVIQYDERYDSDEEIGTATEQTDSVYQALENKRSLKIKPLNMFKDAIALQQENSEKKKILKELEELNKKLRNQYDECIRHNDQLEQFFREVQFTFQPQRKVIHASEAMVRAKKNLYQEAKQAKDRLKKIYKSSQASAIQQIKTYMSTLQTHKQMLKKMVKKISEQVAEKFKNQDFNAFQSRKFDDGCRNIRKILDNSTKMVTQRHQQYKIQKMQIKGSVRARHFQAKKKHYRQQCQIAKSLLLELESLQYEVSLLKHRVKDSKKQLSQYQELMQKIKMKQAITSRLQKQSNQKAKTCICMQQWSKQYKKQLDDRKFQHGKVKAGYQSQINTLTSQFQQLNRNYKTGLFQEQVAKRKGTKEVNNITNEVAKPIYRKMVTFDDIRVMVKYITFYLLENEIDLDGFIQELLRSNKKTLTDKENKKVKIKTMSALEKYPSKDIITSEEIAANLEIFHTNLFSKEEYHKLGQFIVEDGNGKPSINKKIARQVMKNLLRREIEGKKELQEAEKGVRSLLRLHCDTIRPQLKLSGGFEEEIDMSVVKSAIKKYGLDPYSCNVYSEFIQYSGWQTSKTIGFIKLEDYDQMVNRLIKAKQAEATTEKVREISDDEDY